MVERRTVAPDVAGSIPVTHPNTSSPRIQPAASQGYSSFPVPVMVNMPSSTSCVTVSVSPSSPSVMTTGAAS